jgi:hypothetical protein
MMISPRENHPSRVTRQVRNAAIGTLPLSATG